MKKIILALVTMGLSLAFSPELMAGTNKGANTEKVTKATEAQAMMNRLREIKAMDMSKLNKVQKKELRDEVLTMEKKFATEHPVVYISGGALLLIIILLILLL